MTKPMLPICTKVSEVALPAATAYTTRGFSARQADPRR
jgi:hypothetical protein